MDYDYVLDRLDSIRSELITLSSEACYGARGRVAVRHIVLAITEVQIARTHVAGQQSAESVYSPRLAHQENAQGALLGRNGSDSRLKRKIA